MKRTSLVVIGLLLAVGTAQAAVSGQQLFIQKCAVCHAVNGKGGKIGPELGKISARLSAAAIKAQLENPKKANPASPMPSFKTLPKGEMDALLGYLKTLK